MLLTKNIFSAVLLLLTPYCANAQESLFREFLKEFKQCRQIELSCYGDIKMSKNPDVDEKLYKDFIPSDVEGSWLKGSYIKHGDLIIAMLRRWRYDFNDRFEKLFVEYEFCDYMLITYSGKGEILDYKAIGYYGGGSYGTTYFARITPTGDPLTFRVEQATLDGDGKLMEQYKEDLIYTVTTHEYTISPDGKINDKPLGTTKEHRRPEGADSHTIKSFEQFKSFFVKCDKPYVNDSLFVHKLSKDGQRYEYLPVPDSFDFIPDTILCDITPRDVSWNPCRYIEAKGRYYFFIVESAYVDSYYKILEFSEDGRFNRQYVVFHWGDDVDIYKDDVRVILAHRLKKYEHLWNTSR